MIYELFRKKTRFLSVLAFLISLPFLMLWFFLYLVDKDAKITPHTDKKEIKLPKASYQSGVTEVSRDSQLSKVRIKTPEEKQAVMEADMERMSSLGLYYDYANLGLVEVVEAYLLEYGIDPSHIAFSYKHPATGHTFSMNETEPMTAGSTYKMPLNMLVVDEVAKGKFSLTERFDITNTNYEYRPEHDAYVAQFPYGMTISDMQEYSLVYSENTPAYALADRFGGLDVAFSHLSRYGQSKGEIKTIRREDNKTTTDYFINVLEHLYRNQEKYADIIYFMDMSFPGLYYETYLSDIRIVQKPGYVAEALNVDAMVFEESPYLVAIYTRYLGGATEASSDVNDVGYMQLAALTYVINQWHRVNENGLTN